MLSSVILLVVLIFVNAAFASAEIAVISLNEVKLKKLASEGDKRVKRLNKLTKQPARFLATIQVAITLASLLQSAFAADNFAEPMAAALLKPGFPFLREFWKQFALSLSLLYFHIFLLFSENWCLSALR